MHVLILVTPLVDDSYEKQMKKLQKASENKGNKL